MMKKRILIAFSVLSITAVAQPVIQDGSGIPTIGYTAPVSVSFGTYVGNSGSNQTWDYSSYFFSSIGSLSVIAPSSSSIGSSFPTSNLAYSLAGTYSFFNLSPGKFDVIAYAITSPGSGNDYSPNPRTLLKFPFNYQDVYNDSCQIVGNPATPLTLTYDGYGTLIAPDATYSNVVRVKEDYGSGGVDYEWYTVNPLIILMQYRHSSNTLYYTKVNVTTGISEQNNTDVSVKVYPNPVKGKLKITIPASSIGSKFILHNMLGETVKQSILTSNTTEINIQEIVPGVYFYTVENNESLSSGKLIVE